MSNGVQGPMVYRGDGAHGQWHGALRYRGMGYRGWGKWAIGAQGAMWYGANGVQRYRAHGQWHGAMRFRGYGYRDWGTWAMGAQG